MGRVRLAYSHLGIGSAAVCGCHDQAGGFLRANDEPPAAVGTTRVGGAASLFHISGSGTWILDLGSVPLVSEAHIVISDDVPAGTTLEHHLYGSLTGAFAGEETDLGLVEHGDTISDSYRYFKLVSTFEANANRDRSPEVDFFMVIYQRGYPDTGSLNILLDVGFTPERNGSWEIDSVVPAGSTLTLTAEASNRDTFPPAETVTVGAIAHGNAISIRKRFYRIAVAMATDSTSSKTPRLKRIKATFPNG